MDFREAGEPVSHSLNPTREGVMLNSKSCFLIAPAKWLALVWCAQAIASRGKGHELARVVDFAAASAKSASGAISEAWNVATGKEVSTSYGSSASRARQIDYGAGADTFMKVDRVSRSANC